MDDTNKLKIEDGFDEAPKEVRRFFKAHVDERTADLVELVRKSTAESIKYLLLVNGGGAVAILAYLGTGASGSTDRWFAVLGCFVVGVVLVGFLRAIELIITMRRANDWNEGVANFYGGKTGFDELNANDAKASLHWLDTVATFVWVLSFLCFIGGTVVGGTSLYKRQIVIEAQGSAKEPDDSASGRIETTNPIQAVPKNNSTSGLPTKQ